MDLGLFVRGVTLWRTIIVGVLIFVTLKLIHGIRKFWTFHKYFNSFPGESDFHWLFGNLHKMFGDEALFSFMCETPKRFPIFHRVWRSPMKAVIVCHHNESVKRILKTSDPKPHGLGSIYTLGVDWLGEGLLISNGRKWARNRKLLTSAFHFDILQPYIRVKCEAANVLLNKIESCVQQNKSFEVFEYNSLCTLDILLRCAFSYRDDIQRLGEQHPYIKVIKELEDTWVKRGMNPLLYPNFIFYLTPDGRKFSRNCKFAHDFAEKIIVKRRRELETTTDKKIVHRKYLDFLDILLRARDENNEGLSPMDIRSEADTFLFEGHDTTTSGLSYIMYVLAAHPEHQRKIQKELDKIYAEKKDKYLTISDLQKMEYMIMCIKEGLRLYTPVPFIERILTEELDIDGYKIPPHTSVAVSIYSLHRNPSVWENPEEYRPERFLPENVKNRDSFAFVPFSAGSRNCIGQNFAMHSIKVILATILHKYTLVLDESIPVRQKMSVVTKAIDGIYLFAQPRTDVAI